MSDYCFASLTRAGLGNCMLPWARAVIFAKERGLSMIAPSWVQPRFGALFRNEPRKRFYFHEFTNKGYVTGFRRAALLATAERIAEDDSSAHIVAKAQRENRIFLFEGLRNYFEDIKGQRDVINDELLKIVNPAILRRVAAACDGPFIAVNVRRGDLTNQGFPVGRLAAEPRYTPDDWFNRAIEATRQQTDWAKLPVKVVSDGTDAETVSYLRHSGASLATVRSAVGDILMMSKAKLLIASGHSTFSMWASFLGGMSTIYHPGKMQQKVHTATDQVLEVEWAPGEALPPPIPV
jgi:hypothetical protein